jgi:iron complex outermembrane receptor protein
MGAAFSGFPLRDRDGCLSRSHRKWSISKSGDEFMNPTCERKWNFGRAGSKRWIGRILLLCSLPVLWLNGALAQEAKSKPDETQKETELKDVVVTATRTEKDLSETPGSAAVVTQSEIQKRNASTIDQVINTIPGVFDRRGKGDMDTLAAISLRGFPTQQRTLIMIDGLALNDGYTGGVQFGGLSAQNVERVEVVKGPFSSLYGGFAMGGAVNVITRMPEKREFIFSAGYGGGLGTGRAMNDLGRFYVSYGDSFKGKLGVLIGYGRNRTNGYANEINSQSVKPPSAIGGYTTTVDPQGSTKYLIGDKGDNTWWDDNLSLKLAYEFSNVTKLTFLYMIYRYQYDYDAGHTYLTDSLGAPVYSYTSGSSSVRAATYLNGAGYKEQNVYSIGFETEIGRAKLQSSLNFLNNNKYWYTTPGSTATTTAVGGPGTVADTPAKRISGNFQFTLPLYRRHILTLGADFSGSSANTEEYGLSNWKDENARGNMTYNAKGKTATGAFFLQDELSIWSDLTAYLGLRGDYWRTFSGYANQVGSAGYPISYEMRSAFSTSPKAAIVYKPFVQTVLRTSVGRAFRAPSVYELYRTWTSSTGTIYQGNPDLKPETSTSWDLGIDQGLWKGAVGKVAYFENYMSNIMYRKTNLNNSKIQDYINAAKASGRGVEMEIGQKVLSNLKLFVNGTFNSAHITKNPAKTATEGKRLTYLPRWMTNVGAEYERGRLTATLTGRYVAKLYTNDENKDVVSNVPSSYDPYFTLDTKLSLRLANHLKLSFSVDNLLNREFFYSYLAPGRSCFVELRTEF